MSKTTQRAARGPMREDTLIKPADLLMKQAVISRVFPGAVLHVSVNSKTRMHKAYGQADIFTGQKMTRRTIFDLASLTKPLATTLLVMKLIQSGRLNLDDSLGKILPQFRQTDKQGITIRQLLAHDSGLPDYRPYFETLQNVSLERRPEALRNLLINEPLVYSPGHKTLYSDVGFMILAWVVESIFHQSLDRLAIEEIFIPLGLKTLYFNNLTMGIRPGSYAATEHCPWRKIVLKGAVHDDNAFVMGGVAGHAGLFGTAADVYRLLSTLLSVYHGQQKMMVFNPEVLHVFLDRPENAPRALGFDAPAAVDASCGRYFSKNTVGHLGYTGTSFWLDLDRSIIIILLTNRVHPSRDNFLIRTFRPILHDAVMEFIM